MTNNSPPIDLERCKQLFAADIPEFPEAEDEWWEAELIQEHVTSEGRRVFRYFWNSGSPGAGAGGDDIYLLKDLYFTWADEIGFFGPFEEFEEAVQHLAVIDRDTGLIGINDATEIIDCEPWSNEQLLERLEVWAEPELPTSAVRINGTVWQSESLAAETERLRGGRAE